MQYIEAVITTSSQELESLIEKLENYELSGLVVEDEADFKDFLENNRQYWDYVDEELETRFTGVSRIKFYTLDEPTGRSLIARISEELSLEIQTSVIADSDWENNWKQYYKPIETGDRLIIVPEWEEVESIERKVLRLNPGLIFGTGSHATTRMCLEAIEGYAQQGKRILDLGCGSGILSIAALVLGADIACGCDIDPKAPEVAASNAELNEIGESRFKVFAGDILSDRGLRKSLGRGYDVVLANIVADVIIPLAPIAAEFMAKDGVFICSGIIEGRQAEVERALLDAGFKIDSQKSQDEWHCYVTSR